MRGSPTPATNRMTRGTSNEYREEDNVQVRRQHDFLPCISRNQEAADSL
jgi:hypothetical protein